MRVRPDGTLGAVLASEGLGVTETLVNGAGGCRSRTQILMRDVIPRYSPEGTGCCGSGYFSRQSRLPCTYLNGDDMVFGCDGKVEDAVDSIRKVSGKDTAMVDTLAASLACTDHSLPVGGGPLVSDGDLSSMTFDEGYDVMTRTILEDTDLSGEREGVSINILGYGISDMGWETGMSELRGLLSAIGVDDVRFVGCRDGGMEGLGSADLDVMVHPQRSMMTAKMIERRYGVPYMRPARGAPVGYSATIGFIEEISERLGLDPSPALKMISDDEKEVRMRLLNLNKGVNALRSKVLCMDCESSIAFPLTVWMVEKFGLVPRSVTPLDDAYRPELSGYLEDLGFSDALDAPIPESPDVVFTDGVEAGYGMMSRTPTSYIPIRIPFLRNIDLLERCVIGTRGCRYLLDEMLNNVGRFRCGQPSNADMR